MTVQKISLPKVFPKKRWGQNFLIDPNITRKILDCAEVKADENILEIGPGRGFLTEALLKRGAKVTAIEIDPDCIEIINQSFETAIKANLKLIRGDALKYPFSKLPSPYKVVANLPYYISTPILFRLLEEKTRISQMVLMLQKEVAQRMVASAGTSAYGALSIMLQFYADVKLAFTVSAHCFKPKPKVASAVVSIRPLKAPRIQVKDVAVFSRIVKGAFQYRRKRLNNALVCAGFAEDIIKKSLKNIDVDPARRGETLSIQEFAALADAIDSMKQL